MADLTPNNREEHWLKGMVDGSTDLTPNNRKEHWYQEIINAGGGGGGGGGGVLVVGRDMQTMALNKTWKEIHDSPLTVVVIEEGIGTTFNLVFSTEGNAVASSYVVYVAMANISETGEQVLFNPVTFVTDSENGYPAFEQG